MLLCWRRYRVVVVWWRVEKAGSGGVEVVQCGGMEGGLCGGKC